MAFARFNNAAGGTNGIAVTTSNSGGASGDAFDFASSGHVVQWFIPRPGGPPLNYRTAATPNVGWNIPGSLADLYARLYFLSENTASVNFNQVRTVNAGTLVSGVFSSASKLGVKSSAGGTNVVGTYVMSANTWYRVEIRHHLDPSAGYTEAYLYALSGTQLDHVITSTANNSSGGNVTYIPYTAGASGFTYYDSLAISDQGWIGAAADIPTVTSRKGSAFLDVMA